MKTCIAILALVAIAAAQYEKYDTLIRSEVKSILIADPGLTVDQCTTKCDALFDLVNAYDEQYTDDVCKRTCECEKNLNCPEITQAPPATTAAPAHTHHPHPTHPPHPSHPPHGGH